MLKSIMLNSLFSRFLFTFALFAFLIFVLTFFNFIYIDKKHKLNELYNDTKNLQLLFAAQINEIDNFYIIDLVNPSFYASAKSSYIQKQDSLYIVTIHNIEKIKQSRSLKLSNKQLLLDSLVELIKQYNQTIDTIVQLSLERGFQNFGTEGKMRFYAHKLEQNPNFEKWKILMLRRHEKDYIIRLQDKYKILFRERILQYSDEIIQSNLSKSIRDTIISDLHNYLLFFNQLVAYDSIIGIKNNTQLSYNLKNKQSHILNYIHKLSNSIYLFILDQEKKLKYTYLLISLFVVLSTFLLGIVIIIYLNKPLVQLSSNIKEFVESGFKANNNLTITTKITEIKHLANNYMQMKKQILLLLNDFQKQVEERTKEIKLQKEEIENQKITLEKNNKYILDSIRYAQQIQQAIFPNESLLKENFTNYILIYYPKDIIGGDFLWLRRIQNDNFNIKLLAVADCTGHGVPGALMSMLSIAYINEIVLRKDVLSASEVLEVLRHNIVNNFNHDGLDIALVIVHLDKKILEFAGANRNLYIKRNREVIKIKGNKMPIGKYPIYDKFDNHYFDLQPNDKIFVFTDGITDQFNKEGFKIGTRKVLDIIRKNEDLQIIKYELELIFLQSKGSYEQTDDILFLGCEL